MLHATNGVNVDWSGMLLCNAVDGPFLEKWCDNSQNNSFADCVKMNKQQSSNTADMQHSINVHLCNTTASKSFHKDSVAHASNNTHRRPSTTNDTATNKHTQTNRDCLVGTEQKLLDNPTSFSFFQKKVLNST